jgi:hypothetical protein
VISPSQGPLHDNTQQSQLTDVHVPGGIRNRNPSQRAITGIGPSHRTLILFGYFVTDTALFAEYYAGLLIKQATSLFAMKILK